MVASGESQSMTVDPFVIPGLLLLTSALIVLAAGGYAVARVALR